MDPQPNQTSIYVTKYWETKGIVEFAPQTGRLRSNTQGGPRYFVASPIEGRSARSFGPADYADSLDKARQQVRMKHARAVMSAKDKLQRLQARTVPTIPIVKPDDAFEEFKAR